MSYKKYLPNKTLKSIQNRFLFPSFPIKMFGEERTYHSTTFIYCTRQYFSIPPKTIHSFPWATQKPSCHPRKPSPVPSARHDAHFTQRRSICSAWSIDHHICSVLTHSTHSYSQKTNGMCKDKIGTRAL